MSRLGPTHARRLRHLLAGMTLRSLRAGASPIEDLEEPRESPGASEPSASAVALVPPAPLPALRGVAPPEHRPLDPSSAGRYLARLPWTGRSVAAPVELRLTADRRQAAAWLSSLPWQGSAPSRPAPIPRRPDRAAAWFTSLPWTETAA